MKEYELSKLVILYVSDKVKNKKVLQLIPADCQKRIGACAVRYKEEGEGLTIMSTIVDTTTRHWMIFDDNEPIEISSVRRILNLKKGE